MEINKNTDQMQESEIYRKISGNLLDNYKNIIKEIQKISTIPSPSYKEDLKAEYMEKRFIESGLGNVFIDGMKNVCGILKGESDKNLLICAHIDTVFDMETPLEFKEAGDKLFCPGIGDNSTSLAGMLFLAKAFTESGYVPPCNIVFLANACEEGLGDLKGIKYYLKENKIDAMISIDGTMGFCTNKAVGSRRFKVTVKSEGGHSWSDFGNKSAIHTLGRAIARISEIEVPKEPKTSFNIGKIAGGTSVNTIAENAEMLVDIRSLDNEVLKKTENKIMKIIEEAVNESSSEMTVETVGERPGGNLPEDHIMVKTVLSAAETSGIKLSLNASSTDSNIPLSQGIPAVTIGIYEGGGAHTVNEYIEPETLKKGLPYLALFVMNCIEQL